MQITILFAMFFCTLLANGAPFLQPWEWETTETFEWETTETLKWETTETLWEIPPETLVIPNVTTFTFFKRDGAPALTTVSPVYATTTEIIPEQYNTDKPDIFYNYGAYLDSFHNPLDAIALAKEVSSNIALAKATPTYDGKKVLSSVFQHVPQPTKFSNGDLIDDMKDGHSAVDQFMSSIIRPFLRY